MSFFVTSATSATGNLGGLQGADATCLRLAQAVGQGSRTWRAYLSAERDSTNNNLPAHARDRIGAGPWYNANLARVGEQRRRAARAHGRWKISSSTSEAPGSTGSGRVRQVPSSTTS
jgi:hypothetical protein